MKYSEVFVFIDGLASFDPVEHKLTEYGEDEKENHQEQENVDQTSG